MRSTVKYKALSLFGVAPKLATDTAAEKAKKDKVPFWRKIGAAANMGGLDVRRHPCTATHSVCMETAGMTCVWCWWCWFVVQPPWWVEAGEKVSIIGGKYKGMSGVVGNVTKADLSVGKVRWCGVCVVVGRVS